MSEAQKKSRLPEATVEVVVPFHDVDAMNVAWHGHYVKYFEIARCALLDAIDYNYPQMEASGFAWPVTELWVRYPGPARFGQRLRVSATLTEYEPRLRIDYVIRDAESGARLTKGYTVQVAVDKATGELQFGPVEALARRLEARNG